jgi:hypothetical protein
MSEEKVTNKKEIELLEKRVEELEAELKKVGGIANSYIQAHRDLLGQLRTSYSTSWLCDGSPQLCHERILHESSFGSNRAMEELEVL